MATARLERIELPDFGSPVYEPALSRSVFDARIAALRNRMVEASLDAVVIYGDREHSANIAWACGYDPRFEEALLVVTPVRKPVLFAGNEGFPYAECAAGDFDRILWQPLSLMGQPRDKMRPLRDELRGAGLNKGMKIGLAAWKGFEAEDGTFDPAWLEAPYYLVRALQEFGDVSNAALLFMHPEKGLRAVNELEQLAVFEVAATRTSNGIRRLIRAARPGVREYNAVRAMEIDGYPQSVHINMCAGPRAKYGLPSPSARAIERGDPVVAGFGLMGALNCRAGFMVESASELPKGISDYIEKLVAPYFSAAAAWYDTVGLGVAGGDVRRTVLSHVGHPFFGVTLNPGHLIHLDEWVHSPMTENSSHRLVSGMALQCDIIPATGTDYFMSNIEDGIALADEQLRSSFAKNYPEAWARISARRDFMARALGIELKPEILPFSNIAGWLPPFWMSPHLAMTRK